MSNDTSNTVVKSVHSKAIELVTLLAITVAIWFFMLGPGTYSVSLDYAFRLESGDPARFLLSDHLLWHGSCWAIWQVSSWIIPNINGLMVHQVCNLILFSLALVALWFYLRHHRSRFWLTAFGMLGAFATLKALVGGDVTAGPVLMMTLSLFILPRSGHQCKTLWIILLLSIAPLFHKSLFLMIAGWWLAEVILSEGKWQKRALRATIISAVSVIVALLLYISIWYLFISSKLSLYSWFFLYGDQTSSFFTLNIVTIFKGIGFALYRVFFSIAPFKAYYLGSFWGFIGIGLSLIATVLLLFLGLKVFWHGKKEQEQTEKTSNKIPAILLSVLPSLVFFLFWIPGYYTYWTRFLPAIWVLFALGLPQRRLWFWLQSAIITMLLLVNLPSQIITQQGEETGRFSQWLAPKLTEGDLIILPGNGVLFYGLLPKYFYHVETMTLDVLQTENGSESGLKALAEKTWQEGHKVWLVIDYATWTSERLLQGEQIRYDKGMLLVKNTFSLAPREEFHDPAMQEAWIAECLPRE